MLAYLAGGVVFLWYMSIYYTVAFEFITKNGFMSLVEQYQ